MKQANNLRSRAQWLPVATTILLAAVLTALLALGMQRASQLRAASTALQATSELATHPASLQGSLRLLQRGLESRTYVGDSLHDVQTLSDSNSRLLTQMSTSLAAAGLSSDGETGLIHSGMLPRWRALAQQLQSISSVRSQGLYVDSAQGSSLSASARQLKASVEDLLASEQAGSAHMNRDLASLATGLRAVVNRDGDVLRLMLAVGTAIAAAMLTFALYFSWRGQRATAQASAAEQQVSDILGTVREGLFLVDRAGMIGSTHSRSLSELLRIPDFTGMSLEDLLRPITSEKTLTAAVKFLGLLWRDKVNEELIQSVNPLNQIEVSFRRAQGGRETRYLSFGFRRVRGAAAATDAVLVSVSDVTDRVLLQQELEQMRASNDAQSTMLLQLMKLDPAQLDDFLNSTDIACRKCNAMLSKPGKDHPELHGKLDGVYRELHALKGEAGALGMSTFVQRLHAIESLISSLKEKDELGGDDFVPLVVKLDELLDHANDIVALQQRVGAPRPPTADLPTIAPVSQMAQPAAAAAPSAAAVPVAAPVVAPAPRAPAGLESVLRSLVGEVGQANGRSVSLQLAGLDQVPPQYAQRVKDICIQLLRNSIVHGLESGAERSAAGKTPGGTIKVDFAMTGNDEYELLVEDDGQGLQYERILDKALRSGLLQPAQAQTLDKAAVYRLIFHPGFSTAGQVTEHAGRGVGLDVVNAAVRESGGKIGISTAPGLFTRFRVLLPRLDRAHSSAA